MSAQVLAFGLVKRYEQTTALDRADLSLQGGVTAILGPNGAGKTTLIRCLATVTQPDEGSLLVDGLDPRFESDRIEVRRRLGYLPQDHGLGGSGRVFDLLDYLAVLKDLGDTRTRRHLVFSVLEQVGLDHRARDRLDQLSGGMRQRIGLAQALLGSPSLLVLDEPSAGFDPDERLRMRTIIAERRTGSTVLLSTHLTDEALYADTIIVLRSGRVVFVGTPSSLADLARGRAWLQQGAAPDARASWLQADGIHRCLGTPPSGARLAEPTLEDGYLLLVGD